MRSRSATPKVDLRGAQRATALACVRASEGSAAVEMALVMPVLLILLTGIVQFGILLFVQNSMLNVAMEISRGIAVGELSAAQAESSAQDKLARWGGGFSITVGEPDPGNPADTDVSVTIAVPLSNVVPIDPFGMFKSGDLLAAATARKEGA